MTARRLALGLILVVTAPLVLAAGPAGAGEPAEPVEGDEPGILVVEVDGILDPVTADLVLRSLSEAERDEAALFIVAVDSVGVLDADLDLLVRTIGTAEIPVAVWVGPGEAQARGGIVQLLLAGHVAGAARGAEIGPATPALDRGSLEVAERAQLAARLEGLARERERGPDPARALARGGFSLSGDEAARRGLVDLTSPTLRDLVASLDGREVTVAGETTELVLGEVVEGGDPQEKQVLPIRFRQLDLTDQLQHALTSPFVALLLFVTGLCLIVFEFFAVGIGLASLVGGGLVAASFVGFGHLPVNTVAMGLVVGGVVAVSIDVQAGSPRFWALVGSLLLGVGAFRFYAGAARLDPVWWQVALLVGAALVFLLPGLAALMRSRYSSPTIGREWMVGERGTASTAVDPEGVVTVRDAPWRAVATRAAGIGPGDGVTVTAVRGLVLEVEPTEPDDQLRESRAAL